MPERISTFLLLCKLFCSFNFSILGLLPFDCLDLINCGTSKNPSFFFRIFVNKFISFCGHQKCQLLSDSGWIR